MKQHTTEKANSSKFKTFEISPQCCFLYTTTIPRRLCQNLASLKNAYGPPLVSDKQQDEQLGQQILTMKSKPHHVME